MILSGLLLSAVLAFSNPLVLVIVVVLIPVYSRLLFVVFRSLREAKRISNNALSPVTTNAAEAVRGRLLGRALRCNDFFVQRHVQYVDVFLNSSYIAATFIMFNAVCTNFLSLCLSGTIACWAPARARARVHKFPHRTARATIHTG